jgi:hypothetical protein
MQEVLSLIHVARTVYPFDYGDLEHKELICVSIS